MDERSVRCERTTKETAITLSLNLDGSGSADINSGIGFFDHMLEAFARHGAFDLSLQAQGDLHVDGHHTVEDVGIVLGSAFAQALGEKRGICRYGSIAVPMDEALIVAACDISGRGQLFWNAQVPWALLGTFDATLAHEFFGAFATNAGITLHIRQITGENTHHIIEGIFKAAARALRQAVQIDVRCGDAAPSTKGVL